MKDRGARSGVRSASACPDATRAGSGALALAPPAYGIDFVDRGMPAQAPIQLRRKPGDFNGGEDLIDGVDDMDDITERLGGLHIGETESPQTSLGPQTNPFALFGSPSRTEQQSPPPRPSYQMPSSQQSPGLTTPNYGAFGYTPPVFGQQTQPQGPSSSFETPSYSGIFGSGFGSSSPRLSFSSLGKTDPEETVTEDVMDLEEDGTKQLRTQRKAAPGGVIQRGVNTRSGGSRLTGPGLQSYKGMSTSSGGGHPPVPKSKWQSWTVNNVAYKFWNDADGALEFTGRSAKKPGAGPFLVPTTTVDIEDSTNPDRMKFTGYPLKNSRYQHFLVANMIYEKTNGAQPLNQGYSPPGLTWHHHKEKGIMELIDRDVHGAFGHHGGFSIWGS
jgi:hypothetical protein